MESVQKTAHVSERCSWQTLQTRRQTEAQREAGSQRPTHSKEQSHNRLLNMQALDSCHRPPEVEPKTLWSAPYVILIKCLQVNLHRLCNTEDTQDAKNNTCSPSRLRKKTSSPESRPLWPPSEHPLPGGGTHYSHKR